MCVVQCSDCSGGAEAQHCALPLSALPPPFDDPAAVARYSGNVLRGATLPKDLSGLEGQRVLVLGNTDVCADVAGVGVVAAVGLGGQAQIPHVARPTTLPVMTPEIPQSLVPPSDDP